MCNCAEQLQFLGVPGKYGTDIWGTWATIYAHPLKSIAGKTAFASDLGPAGIFFITDGTYWRPENGRALLYRRTTSVASPISTVSGVTTGLFTLPQTLLIPAGLIPPMGGLNYKCKVLKTGGNGSAVVVGRLGALNTNSDPQIVVTNLATATLSVLNFDSTAEFGAGTTSVIGMGGVPLNNNVVTGAYTDISTNTQVNLYANFALTGANTGDSFGLSYYSLWLEG